VKEAVRLTVLILGTLSACIVFGVILGAVDRREAYEPTEASANWEQVGWGPHKEYAVYSSKAKLPQGTGEAMLVGILDGVTPTQCLAAVTDWDHLDENFPYVKFSARVGNEGPGIDYVFTYLSLPLIRPRFYTQRLVKRTEIDGAIRVSWSRIKKGHPFHRTPGEMNAMAMPKVGRLSKGAIELLWDNGYWLFEAVQDDDDSTRVVYKESTNLGSNVPAWIVHKALFAGLPKLWKALKKSAEEHAGTQNFE
jgi:hypothetical protein